MLNIKAVKVDNEMLSIIAEIDEFKGAWNVSYKDRPSQLYGLRTLATIESIGSSNRIEGNKLSDSEVEAFLSRINRKSFASRDEEEVAGYAELMGDIYDNYEVIPFNESYVKQLHQILLKYSAKDEWHRGEYKKFPNIVAAYDAQGIQMGIVFETSTPFDTPEQMRQLVKTTRNILEDKAIHPLIAIGLFIVHFLAIHPFQDGNGRLSRALTSLMLLKSDYIYVPYSSMESIIETGKEGYYRALRQTQHSFGGDYNYTPWLMFFLRSLQKQKLRLETKLRNINAAGEIDRLDSDILTLFSARPKLAIHEIADMLDKNINTIKKRVYGLVDAGHLKKSGKTKGVWYERR
jgi:Fic family protein